MGYTKFNTETEISDCEEQRRLSAAEHALRADAMLESDPLAASRLANAALLFQRRRRSHTFTCAVCSTSEFQGVAA